MDIHNITVVGYFRVLICSMVKYFHPLVVPMNKNISFCIALLKYFGKCYNTFVNAHTSDRKFLTSNSLSIIEPRSEICIHCIAIIVYAAAGEFT